jgi:hypothetical protein
MTHAMFLVEIRLNPLDLSNHMSDMRVWLDRNCVETAGFPYKEHIDRALAHVAFKGKAGAEAFAARFAVKSGPCWISGSGMR